MNYTKEINKYPILNTVSKIAKDIGIEAYVVGGFVRDLVLGIENDDIDIVCVGSGISLAEHLSEYINGEVTVYPNFGTAMVKYGERKIEFVGARKEFYQRGSRKPFVFDGNLMDDLGRRDLTINAMCISLNQDNFGELIDNFGGLKDLKHGIIRFVGNPIDRLREDPLRALRAIRFSCKLSTPGKEFHYSIDSINAIKECCDEVKYLSSERITEEIDKIMLSKTPSKGIRVLSEVGLLKQILPEVEDLKLPGETGHKNIFDHTMAVLDNVVAKSDNLYLRYAALLHDIGKVPTRKKEGNMWTFYGHAEVGSKMVETVFRRMKMPTDARMEYVKKMVALHMRPTTLAEEGVTDSAIRRILFDAGDDFDDLMILCLSDVTSRYEAKRQRVYDNIVIIKERAKEIEEKDAIRNFKNPITGDYIMQVFGLNPCRAIATIKDYVKEAILDGRIGNNFEEAREAMLEIACGEMGLRIIGEV